MWILKLMDPYIRACLLDIITGIFIFLYFRRTGKVFNVGKRSLGVIIEKQVGNKYHEKRICVRLEHVKPSRCREDYLKRKAENRERKLLAQKNGTVFKPIKRMPEEPKRAHLVSTKNNDPVLVTPIAYERLI